MNRITISACFGLALLASNIPSSVLCAQDRAGTWEGSITQNRSEFVIGLKTAKDRDGKWTATIFNSSLWPVAGVRATSVAVSDSLLAISFTFGDVRYSYTGTFNSGARGFQGTFAGADDSFPLTLRRVDEKDMRSLDRSNHATRLVMVQPNVFVEVVDWGGSGAPLLFIPGKGHTAHVYDELVKHFTPRYHVYGLTRRGFGDSSVAQAVANDANGGYPSDQMGDDVLAVLEKLKIARPVLIGHSLGGVELSSVCSRHPEKVAGLVYLDAVASYSYNAGQKNMSRLPCTILAFIPVPHIGRDAADLARMIKTADEFEAGVSGAHVVRLKDADHAVWTTHEPEIVREMNDFLPRAFRSEVAARVTESAASTPVAAADISGHWQGVLSFQGPRSNERAISLQIAVEGNNISGTIRGAAPGGKDAPIQGVKLSGDQISFEVPTKDPDGKDMWILFAGTVKGVRMEGTNAVRTSDSVSPMRKMASVWTIEKK